MSAAEALEAEGDPRRKGYFTKVYHDNIRAGVVGALGGAVNYCVYQALLIHIWRARRGALSFWWARGLLVARATQDTLAEMSDVGSSQVRRSLKVLLDLGVITRIADKWRNHIYILGYLDAQGKEQLFLDTFMDKRIADHDKAAARRLIESTTFYKTLLRRVADGDPKAVLVPYDDAPEVGDPDDVDPDGNPLPPRTAGPPKPDTPAQTPTVSPPPPPRALPYAGRDCPDVAALVARAPRGPWYLHPPGGSGGVGRGGGVPSGGSAAAGGSDTPGPRQKREGSGTLRDKGEEVSLTSQSVPFQVTESSTPSESSSSVTFRVPTSTPGTPPGDAASQASLPQAAQGAPLGVRNVLGVAPSGAPCVGTVTVGSAAVPLSTQDGTVAVAPGGNPVGEKDTSWDFLEEPTQEEPETDPMTCGAETVPAPSAPGRAPYPPTPLPPTPIPTEDSMTDPTDPALLRRLARITQGPLRVVPGGKNTEGGVAGPRRGVESREGGAPALSPVPGSSGARKGVFLGAGGDASLEDLLGVDEVGDEATFGEGGLPGPAGLRKVSEEDEGPPEDCEVSGASEASSKLDRTVRPSLRVVPPAAQDTPKALDAKLAGLRKTLAAKRASTACVTPERSPSRGAGKAGARKGARRSMSAPRDPAALAWYQQVETAWRTAMEALDPTLLLPLWGAKEHAQLKGIFAAYGGGAKATSVVSAGVRFFVRLWDTFYRPRFKAVGHPPLKLFFACHADICPTAVQVLGALKICRAMDTLRASGKPIPAEMGLAHAQAEVHLAYHGITQDVQVIPADKRGPILDAARVKLNGFLPGGTSKRSSAPKEAFGPWHAPRFVGDTPVPELPLPAPSEALPESTSVALPEPVSGDPWASE